MWRNNFRSAMFGLILVSLTYLALRFPADLPKNLMIAFSAIFVVLSLTKSNVVNEIMHLDTPLWSPLGMALTIGAATFVFWNEMRLIGFSQIVADYPDIGLLAQFYLWLASSHLLSYITHSILFVILWRTWKRFLPTLTIVLLEIGLSEFSFMGSQVLQFGWILPYYWTWYISFAIILLPFLVSYEFFDISDKRLWLAFMFGMVFIYFNAIIGFRDPYTWDYEAKMFRSFPELVYEVTAWYSMLLNRVGKVIMALSFALVNLKSEKTEKTILHHQFE